MTYQPKAEEIKHLRELTDAPMMACRKALVEAGGDVAAAKQMLLERGAAQAQKKAERAANEGVVASYIHAGGKIGVLVEINSETDFVARSPKFAELARDVAMHIAAMSPKYVERSAVPPEVVESVRDELRAEVPKSKTPEIAEKIVDGKLKKWFEETVLLEQPFVKDDEMTVSERIGAAVGALGENIRVRRFAKFALGEE
ncbi:MAG: translation elongation factor Ts [Candidatus Tyrphobacter sp.]